ncbi:acyl-CoA reductase-like NAD-dependent aldehyde dehydrogenase [Chryseobacterium vietnamense]|uniref:Acyl-CoA reductase-like NAD-dependent aldehyde dehydrogenase n=1 Tax=Chryseobacterium vietnamense TaxID=866785 RepID=A0ACC6JBG7_9FLAO|nr:aldehyde dehydrogenase family protein [Chryseobacterium vietnamense]MDR6460415.1 acyl-CoA reductase-like NAD-dependent aldehyde dehydrogenase [Chryseobacterium vietnamense]
MENTSVAQETHTPDTQFLSLNPSTLEVIGEVTNTSREEIDTKIEKAKKAQKLWAARPDAERKEILLKVAEALQQNSKHLAEWITREQGKPLNGPGANFEMQGCVGWTQVPASLDLPEEIVFEDETRKDVVYRNPIGVVAAIAPWNWPLMIAIWQIIPSLRMGNAVIIKPSEYTTYCSLEMIKVINSVLPEDILQVVTGRGEVGGYLTSHPEIGKIMFTGSIATGKKVIEASAKNMARLTLECGGNDAGIILPGLDIAKHIEGIFWGAFLNMGQTCACLKRLYVHENDYEKVVKTLADYSSHIPMGNGADEGIVLGPIQNKMQYDKIQDLIRDSENIGADFIFKGQKPDLEGYFIPVTLIGNVDNGDRIVDEEQFGPVLPIITYKTVDEAISKANDSENGLGASVWSDNLDEAQRVAAQLEAGTVWINQHGAIHPFVPFGGAKQSGYGVEFGIEGLKAVTVPKVISIKK